MKETKEYRYPNIQNYNVEIIAFVINFWRNNSIEYKETLIKNRCIGIRRINLLSKNLIIIDNIHIVSFDVQWYTFTSLAIEKSNFKNVPGKVLQMILTVILRGRVLPCCK